MTDISALDRARDIRLTEKARYLEINSSIYPDVIERWRAYEQLVYYKYNRYNPNYPRYRKPYKSFHWERALDVVWIARDKQHQNRANRTRNEWSHEANTLKAHSGRANENR